MRLLKKQIGQQIKRMRIAAGLSSQLKLAHALGVEQSTVARWESGVTTPTEEHLEKLARILKVDIGDFLAPTPSMDLPTHPKLSDLETRLKALESQAMVGQVQSPEAMTTELLTLKNQAADLKRQLAESKEALDQMPVWDREFVKVNKYHQSFLLFLASGNKDYLSQVPPGLIDRIKSRLRRALDAVG